MALDDDPLDDLGFRCDDLFFNNVGFTIPYLCWNLCLAAPILKFTNPFISKLIPP